MNKIQLNALVLGVAITISGCATTTNMGYGSDRKQVFISSGEFAIKRANKHTSKTLEASELPYHDPAQARVVSIINALSPYADQYLADGKKVKWDLLIHKKKNAPAGILANGTIVMNRDFIYDKALEKDEALAYIVAHEMAHVVRQHHREREAWSYIAKPALLATAYLATGPIAMTAGLGFDLPIFNKKLEKEADLLGLEIMSKAGFDPRNAVNVYDDYHTTFKANHPIASRLPSIIMPHPSFKARTDYSSKHLDKAIPIYEASKNQPRLENLNPIKPNINPDQVIVVNPVVIEKVKENPNNDSLSDQDSSVSSITH
jgi:predicted Zn-dependent protease